MFEQFLSRSSPTSIQLCFEPGTDGRSVIPIIARNSCQPTEDFDPVLLELCKLVPNFNAVHNTIANYALQVFL